MAPLAVTEPQASAALEPVAIIGMGCRWPGDSETPSELWDFLEAKRDSYSKFPPDRINGDAFYHPDPNRPGSFKTEGGSFLKSDVRQFDANFFGIHPKEVLTLDPAQRKLLEVVYEAFESAGVPLHQLSGSYTGTFMGNFNYDHQLMQYRDAENALPYSVTGSGVTLLSNRINYIFNLKGPSMTLDTACSSSLYALHLACSAIQTGDCTAAIVGGSNLILTPECQIFSSVLGAVSPTSVCHTFDSRADGYARADGIGALFIKKLSQAVADGDPIRAVIRGTAFNANGRTGGITHPSPDGQEACMRRAYERAGGLDVSLTGYFECHGTGTPVGDPIEVSAIGRLFADAKSPSDPLLIGSIKSNMGHSEPSSGIAGVMKAVLAIERGIIPPTIGIQSLNPNVDLRDGRLKIVTESTPWPDLPVRRASINSFGYGGSNAHAIIESAESLLPGYRARHQASRDSSGIKEFASANGVSPMPSPTENGRLNGYSNGHINSNGHSTLNGNGGRSKLSKTRFLLPFSAHDDKTLRANYKALAQNISNWNLEDIAFTLSARRSLLTYRSFVLTSVDTTKHGLPDADEKELSVTKRLSSANPVLGFVFTGQGAQWPQMGLSLMNEFPSVLSTIRRLDGYLDDVEERSWSIEDVLNQNLEYSLVHNAELSQPLVTALQIALVNLLSLWNIKPGAVVGHSSGEIAASYAAGMLTEREAMIAAYLRGAVVAQNNQSGLMMAVGCRLPYIESLVDRFGGEIVIACHNSLESYTLSGDADAIIQLKKTLDEENIFCRLLSTNNNAYHSHHMKAFGSQYETKLEAFSPKDKNVYTGKNSPNTRSARAVFFSSLYGHSAPWSLLGPKYWRQNLESPVLFHQAVTDMVTKVPIDTLVEIGPHSALQGPLRQVSKAMGTGFKFPEYLTAIVRGDDNVKNALTLAGNLYNRGYEIDLARANAVEDRGGHQCQFGNVITDLPRYQWQYSKDILLYENRYTREWRLRMHPRHDILGSRVPGGNRLEPTWRNMLSMSNVPWLKDHQLGTETVFPSTGYLCMVLEAATQVVEVEGRSSTEVEYYDIRDVSLSKALIVPEDDHGIETLFSLRPASLNTISRHPWAFEFTLTSVSSEEGRDVFSEHCRGLVEVNFERYEFPVNQMVKDVQAAASVKKTINAAQWYQTFARVGLRYGPTFQGLSSIFAIGDKNLAEAQIGLGPAAKMMKGESRYLFHPATLDASMQLSILAAHKSDATKFQRAFMPTAFDSIKVWPKLVPQTHGFAKSYASAQLKGVRGLSSDIVLLDAHHQRILEVNNVFLTASDQSAPKLIEDSCPYTRVVWKPDFSHLSTAIMEKMYEPVVLSDDAVIPSLNHLALHQLIDFKATNPKLFAAGSQEMHLQRLLDWTTKKLDLAKADPNSHAQMIMRYSDDFRTEEIKRLADTLKPQSSEARLMCHLYDHLPAIYKGEKTGIQVALQDNLLLDNYETGQVYREGNRRLAATVSLYAHQNPGLKILEVGAGTGSATNEVLPALKGDSVWRQYSEYRFTDTTTSFLSGAEDRFSRYSGMTFGSFDMEKAPDSQGYEQDWDLVIASNVIHATSDIKKTLKHIRSILKPGGKMILLELTQSQLSAGLVLGTFSDFWKADHDPTYPRYDGPFLSKSLWRTVLPDAGFSGVDFFLDDYAGDNVSATVICATAIEPQSHISPSLSSHQSITFVYRDSLEPFMESLASHISNTRGVSIDCIPLTAVDSARYPRFVFLLETKDPFFLNVTAQEWTALQLGLKRSLSSIWLTKGDLMVGKEPTYAMISGLAKGMRTENSSLRFGILDLDKTPDVSDTKLFSLIDELEARVADITSVNDDSEFRYKDGTLYISRLTADDGLNEKFNETADKYSTCEQLALRDLKATPLQMAIEKPGILSTIYFKPDQGFSNLLAADEVEIEVKYAGVNTKDIAVLTGRHHSNSFSDECSGIITKCGRDVRDLKVGDQVYCQSFSKFGNFVREKAAFCQRLEPGDTLEGTSTLPIAFSTALYGLTDLGRLVKGESVLIQSATGGVGLAACQIAHMIGAEVFATVGTEQKKNELLGMKYGIKEDHILWSREKSSAKKLLEMTDYRGIDVILSSARGDFMHEYWKCIATCGRFIEIGRTEILDNGKLSLDVFRRNATFASFDLEVMSKTKPEITASLMKRIHQLKSQGHIQPMPCQKFHISEVEKAFKTFTRGTHIGKIVLEYDDQSDLGLNVRRDPFTAQFDPNAAYLLVGCLGGLGRSFSTWAVSRGARNLIYLSRSGAGNDIAKAFLDGLTVKGINISVVKGDVASISDVKAAVKNSKLPIKGVVQGALTLHDSLFESMSLEKFNATVHPRVIGTMNLHAALKDYPLDFFELWSSWTVVFGTATQSNYLASNAFLDAFARHRQANGLPCTSLALNQVLGIGIVSYMPEYQQAMIRNGFYGNDEDDFLKYCEAGIITPTARDDATFRYDPQTTSHLLAGIEPAGLQNIGHQYPLSDMLWYRDPRFRNLIQATNLLSADNKDEAVDQGQEGSALDRIRMKISRLLYVPLDEVDVDKPINDFGIDSMIAAELRNWFFASFGKDVSLLRLLSATMTIQKLAEEVGQEAQQE